MTVGEVIERVQALRPHVYTGEQVTSWLSELDGTTADKRFLAAVAALNNQVF